MHGIANHIAQQRCRTVRVWWVCPVSACPRDGTGKTQCGTTDKVRYDKGCRHIDSYSLRDAFALQSEGEDPIQDLYVDVEAIRSDDALQNAISQDEVNQNVVDALSRTQRGQIVSAESGIEDLDFTEGWITVTTPQPVTGPWIPTPSTPYLTTPTPEGGGGWPSWAIALLVLFCVSFVACCVLLIWLLCRRKKRKEEEEKEEAEKSTSRQVEAGEGGTYPNAVSQAHVSEAHYTYPNGVSEAHYAYPVGVYEAQPKAVSQVSPAGISGAPPNGLSQAHTKQVSALPPDEIAVSYTRDVVQAYPDGMRVRAVFPGGMQWTGTVIVQQPDGTYIVNWDDGTHSTDVTPDMIQAL